MNGQRGGRRITRAYRSELSDARRNKLETEIRSLRARKRFTENRIAYWQAVLAGDKAAARQLTAEGDALSEHLG